MATIHTKCVVVGTMRPTPGDTATINQGLWKVSSRSCLWEAQIAPVAHTRLKALATPSRDRKTSCRRWTPAWPDVHCLI
jgi:hypothetical protein